MVYGRISAGAYHGKAATTTGFDLTGDHTSGNGSAIERIEIPIFQRDYAQGREGDSVGRIRTDFLDALHGAVVGDEPHPVGLDFVYGGVDEGTLRPLDGQQRLTTLFLLHWYIASRTGHLTAGHGWTRFSYATRQSARMFCESLVEHPLPEECAPRSWIEDQPWYLFVWQHDPTVQSMLVMLNAIHERFHDVDAATAWGRLIDTDSPAIWFLLLPLSGLASAPGKDMRPEDLYIKMNSRGKPLTEFENFKARFEKTIQWSSRSGDFALKVDTAWSDILWNLRGDDNLVDDEFLRYLEFITEVCEWRDGRTRGAGQRLGLRTQETFGEENPGRYEHLEFLFNAIDVWADHPVSETFEQFFASPVGTEGLDSKVRLFFRYDGNQLGAPNLFEACCRSYGEMRGRARVFSLGQTLTLYAVLLHLTENIDAFPRRVRILRNLIEASTDELRPDQMPKILQDVDRLIKDGDVAGIATLNQAQVEDEKLKAAFLEECPEMEATLFGLEDHDLLHGSLGAFELDPATFESRATTFHVLMSQPEIWPDLLGALLSVGEYQRQRRNSRPFLFGTDSKLHDSAWRDLLTGTTRHSLQPTRVTLAALLGRVAGATDLKGALKLITDEYLSRCDEQSRFDWRYYMVRYPAMRQDGASTYFAERESDSEPLRMGYSLCMLRAGGRALNGYHRDPFLLAIAGELDNEEIVEDKWFMGYETQPRRLPLARSGASLRCVCDGFELEPPSDLHDAKVFAAACTNFLVGDDGIIAVAQAEVDDHPVDSIDRIQLAAKIIQIFADAGL